MKASIHLFSMLLLALVFSLSSCNKTVVDPTPVDTFGLPNPASSSVYMTAKIDGKTWEADEVLALQSRVPGSTIYQYTIKGTLGDDVLQFTLQRPMENMGRFESGSYDVASSQTAGKYIVVFLHTTANGSYQPQPDTVAQGVITIDKASGNTTEGTFEVTMSDFQGGTLEITEGRFKSDKYLLREI